jgi:hypothetical protein
MITSPGEADDHLWPQLVQAIDAAYMNDPISHVDAVLSIGERTARDEQMLLSAWLSYLVYIAIARTVPDVKDHGAIQLVSDAIYPRYTVFIREQESDLQDLLATVLGFPPRGELVTGSRFLFHGSVVAGLVMCDIDTPPEAFLPRLQAWWQKHRTDVEGAISDAL